MDTKPMAVLDETIHQSNEKFRVTTETNGHELCHIPTSVWQRRNPRSGPSLRQLTQWLQRGRACIETRPSGAPQHEVFSRWHFWKLLILRRPPSGRLEGRTVLIQLISHRGV